MLFIWRGFGWLIPVVVFGAFLLSQLSFDAVYGEGFYKANDWPKIAAVVAGSLLIALLGYFFNYRKRQVYVDPDPGSKKKSPAHSLFFIPVEAWAVIVPVVFFWAQSHTAEVDERELAFIQDPVVSDIYAVDFTEIFTEADQEYKYGAMKVTAVQPEGVVLVASEMVYDMKSGVRKDIREGQVKKSDYFSGEPFFLPTKYIEDLKSRDGIFKVSRKRLK